MHPADSAEAKSYRILRSRLDLSALPTLSRAVDPTRHRMLWPVIGVPVGFVGAAEAKDALRRSGLPALSNVSEKGGPAVAAAAFEALLRIAALPDEPRFSTGPHVPPRPHSPPEPNYPPGPH